MDEDCFSKKLSRIASKTSGGVPSNVIGKIDSAIDKALSEVREDINLLDCYSDDMSKLHSKIVEQNGKDALENKAAYQVMFFTSTLNFSATISDIMTLFLQRVKEHLRPFPHVFKQLLGGVQTKLIDALSESIQSYLKEIRKVAKIIGLQGYGFSLGIPPVSITFSFAV